MNVGLGVADILLSKKPLQTADKLVFKSLDPTFKKWHKSIEPVMHIAGEATKVIKDAKQIYSNISMMTGLLSGNSFGDALTSAFGGAASGVFGNRSTGAFLTKDTATGSDIFSFLSKFENGIAKSNRFRVEFIMPMGIDPLSTSSNNESMVGNITNLDVEMNLTGAVNIKCHTMTFPQRALQTYDVKMNSANFRIPYMCAYDPITFSFYADNNLDTRHYFEVWQAAVMNFGNNTMNFYDEYVSNVNMYIQDSTGADIYGITLYEAYPLGISNIDLSYSNDNQVITIMVTLSYKSWLPMNNSNIATPTFGDGSSPVSAFGPGDNDDAFAGWNTSPKEFDGGYDDAFGGFDDFAGSPDDAFGGFNGPDVINPLNDTRSLSRFDETGVNPLNDTRSLSRF